MTTNITPAQALSQIEQLAQQGLAYVPPPPPIDVATWWFPQPGLATKPTFVRQLPDGRLAIYFIKNAAGWPWDIQIADQTGVYFRVTENDAKNPQNQAVGWPPSPPGSSAAYRLYTQSNIGSSTFGFKITPRYYTPSQGRILVSNVQDVPTLRFSDCSTSVPNHLGPAQSWISMQTVAFGGALGTIPSLVAEYYYSVATLSPLTFKTRERFFLTQQSGWVQWDCSQLQSDGSYATSGPSYQVSLHNAFIPDNTLVPVFPCPVML